MLTGALPFTASDSIEWIHCHVAREPTPPNERDTGIPGPISAIVMKLLAKTAEERYQSAPGVEADLKRCLLQWESGGQINPFRLGLHDASDRIRIPEKLYGRDREVKILLDAFDRVAASGRPELTLVAGYAGVGKSSLVHEIQKAIVLPRGVFAEGKFDQQKQDIPYGTFALSLQTMVRQILGKTDIDPWRDFIGKAVDPNGQLIVNLIPELELIIGPQPPVPELPPTETKQRFLSVFRRFLGVFARKEHPLILFLDDLQWADAASLALLEQLANQLETQHLLIIGAYRDNEVDVSHPLQLMLKSIRQTGAVVNEITLKPLSLTNVNQLVSDTFHCQRARASFLSRLVHRKTAGNPFFAIQFLTALAEEGLIEFDAQSAEWKWDLALIRTRRFTDNVVDLMITKLKRLPAAAQEAMKLLACLGDNAGIAVLAIINEVSKEELCSTIWEAIQAGLILKVADSYKFLHDRVREAAYSLIPEQFRAELHLRIGRLLAARMNEADFTASIFTVVNQLNLGGGLILDREERERVAGLNLLAGRTAKTSTAYASACTYLSAGIGLLGFEDQGTPSRRELEFSLLLERAECELLNGNLDDAERLIQHLLPKGSSKVDKAAVYSLKIVLHLIRSEKPQGVETALTCLRLFDIEMSAHPTREQVLAEYQSVWRTLGERPVETLVNLPITTSAETRATMRVLSFLTGPALYTDINLYHLHFCKMVNLSLKHGVSDAAAYGYSGFGVILCLPFQRYDDGYRFAKLACDLVEKHGFASYKAKVYLAMEMVVLWTKPIEFGIELIRAALSAGKASGDISYTCYSCMHLITDLLTQGAHLDKVWEESETCLSFIRESKYRDAGDILINQQQFIRRMRGQTATFSTFSDENFDEASFENQLTEDRMTVMVSRYWILKVQACFLSGDYQLGLAALEKAKKIHWSSEAFFQSLDYHLYAALTLAAAYDAVNPAQQTDCLDTIRSYSEQLRVWAENCPSTFLDKHLLVTAEIARIEGRDLDAMRLYDQAVQSACQNGFAQNEGIANELAARFYLKGGFKKIAGIYLRHARDCYARWGALGKVRQLDQIYLYDKTAAHQEILAIAGTPFEHTDLAAVLKASQAVSGELVLGKLIETLMVIAFEHAGADRGVLILPRKDAYKIEAEAITVRDKVKVDVRQLPVTAAKIPMAILRYVIRTQQSFILGDALVPNLFSEDEYVLWKRPRAVLCLPLIKQGSLKGVIYLENKLAPHVFTPDRLATLELLASQAAISLDHARLYADLMQENCDRRKAEEALRASEERWRKFFENSSAGIALVASDGRFISANLALQKTLGYTEEELQHLNVIAVTHEADRPATAGRLAASAEGHRRVHRIEKRFLRKNGDVIWTDISTVFVPAAENTHGFFATVVVDITERKLAEANLARLNRTLRTLYQCNQALVRATEERELLQSVCKILVEIGGLRMAWVGYRDLDEEKSVRPIAEAGFEEGYLKKVEITWAETEKGQGPVGRAIRTGTACWTRDNLTDPLMAQWRSEALERGYASSISVPLLYLGEAFGALTLYASEPEAFHQETIEQYTDLANNLAFGVMALRTRDQRIRAESEIRQLNASLERRVTERTLELAQSEERLRESEERFSRAFLASPALMTIARLDDGKFVEANGAFVRWFGLERERILGYNSRDLGLWVNLDDRSKFWADLARDGSLRDVECNFRTHRGTIHTMLVSAEIIEVNREPHVLGFFLDITERKRVESELLRMLAKEKELGQLRSNFVSMVSHEFRTPLGIIQSSAEILGDYLDQLESSERNDHLQSIRNNTRRMAVTMEEVLLLGRFDAGKMDFRPKPLELERFARGLIDEVMSATSQRCPIELSLSGTPAEILGDERLLSHIFINLLTNAVKYSKVARPVLFEITRIDSEIVCSVRDEGVGIPEADQKWLFTAFYRGRNVQDRPGTGLGLVIVKRCVDLHRGKITLESKADEGTSVTVTLPVL
jgi:PAS domain S-box-containing protein